MADMSFVTHVLREPAEDYSNPLNTDPMGQTFMSWDDFVIYETASISRTGFFREGPQRLN